MIERWLSLKLTVDFIQTVTGSSLGPACQTLISICKSGEVRARWTGYYERTLPAIHKREWIGADIDWAKYRVVRADGRGMLDVDFSVDDINAWAASRELATAPAVASARFPGDTSLIEEGRLMLAEGMQKRAIARKLAERAEGAGTLESKVDRLRKLL